MNAFIPPVPSSILHVSRFDVSQKVRSLSSLQINHSYLSRNRSAALGVQVPLAPAIVSLKACAESSKEVVLKPSLNIPIALLGLTVACCLKGGGWTVPAVPFSLLGVFLGFQTYFVRFVFTETSLDVRKRDGNGFKLIRGWKYEYFTNWEVWWPLFPVLCYYKEKESYDGRGSIHFFPIIFNVQELIECLQTRTPVKKPNYPFYSGSGSD